MNKMITFTFLVFTFVCYGQKEYLISGKVTLDSLRIDGVHILNENTRIGTVTNSEGVFEIPVKVGDTLSFSHINFDFSSFIINERDVINKEIKVLAIERTYALEEFTLDNRSIFYVDPEIMPYKPVVNAKTLNLPFAGTKKEKDNSLFKLESGATLSLNGIINRLNGNHKRMKKTKKLVSEDESLNKIRKSFTDDFFVTDLKIKEEYINQFLNFCKNKRIISAFRNDNQLELIRILMAESKVFPHQTENENIFLTKN